MSAALDWNVWRLVFTTLALGTTVVVLAGLIAQRWVRPMAWRRTIWQVAFVTMGLLALTEITGGSRALWSWLTPPPQPPAEDRRLAEAKVLGEPDSRMLLVRMQGETRIATSQPAQANVVAPAPIRWPSLIWLLGFGVTMTWMATARLVFAWFVPRRTHRDEGVLAKVRSIAGRLGLSRRVRVAETRGLSGPIAFGILRPGISLPEGFARRYTSEQLDAMLAHELAHLAARDPFWHALADATTAMLWWHPLAWLAKRELRTASESAADEASMVVENGPQVLAECLVELGGRLSRARSAGWLGMADADFRSSLGRRVNRLVSLSGSAWKPVRGYQVWLARIAAPLALLAVVLGTTVWAQPAETTSLRQAFQRSLLGLALTVAFPQTPPEPEHIIDWQPWSADALTAARAESKVVLVHFTADSAAAVKANEQTSLEVPAVRAKLQQLGAVTLRGNYTAADEAIAKELLAFGRTSVPLTLVYPSDPSLPPHVLPEVLTPQIVLDALERGSALSEKLPSSITTDSVNSDRNKAPALILQGKSLQRSGKQAEAKAKFEEALKFDPGNVAAKHYLSLLQQAAKPVRNNSVSQTNLERINPGREAIYRKLDSIRLKEISFSSLPLNEAVEKLEIIVKAADPERKGINFIINNAFDPRQPDPVTEIREPDPFPTTNVVIRLTPPLRDVTAQQAIDAIVRVADAPLHYSVEDYAVVFAQRPLPPALHTRWFRIDANIFIRYVSKLATTNMDQAIKEAISAPPLLVDSPSPGKVYRTSVTPVTPPDQVNAEARRIFKKAGVDFTVPGKSLVFNERLGQLVVRATLEDLDIIEQVIQRLTASPPQVTIEVKFVEVTESDSKALGFNWFLRNTLTQNSGLAAQNELVASNHVVSVVSPGIDTNAPENEPLTGILTDPQYRVVMRALEQRQGVDILTLPKITMLSGRQGQMKTVNVRYVVTDYDLSELISNAVARAAAPNEVKPLADQFELGPVLDVVPYVQADGLTIHLTVIPTITEFLGYDMGGEPQKKTITTADGRTEQVTLPPEPRPIFRKRQIVSSVTAWDGQTVVLARGSDLLLSNPNKNQPLREGTKPPQPKKETTLLIFVTATLIDPAGNRIHKPEDIPGGIPPQR